MSVVLVCGDFRPSHDGVADYTARLAAELQAREVQVYIATLAAQAGEDPSTGEARAGTAGVPLTGAAEAGTAGVAVIGVAGRWDLRGVRRLARMVRALGADVVHVQFAPSAFAWRGTIGLLPALLRRRTRLVVTLHEYDWWAWVPDPCRRRGDGQPPRWVSALLARALWPLLERLGWWDRETGLLTTHADTVVTTNPAHHAALQRRLPRVPARLIPIGSNLRPAALDRDRTRAAVREAEGMGAGAPLLAFFGFIHAVKGIRYLLEATARLRGAHPGLRLLLIGGFESLALRGAEATAYEAEVRDLVAAHGLQDVVRVTGWLPEEEVSRLLTAADAAVLPFTAGTTTKSGALLACAEHGVPIVCTTATPADPALVDGRTALLVATRDATSLAEALARVLGDPALRARLATGARRIAAAHGWPAIAEAHLACYRTPPAAAPTARAAVGEAGGR